MAVIIAAQASPTPNPGCTPNVVPIGQANPPGTQLEPLAPIWCFTPLAAPNAPTRISGANDWTDNFNNVAQSGRFNDGDYDYRQFKAIDGCVGFQTLHFTNNQHWMDDNTGANTCGVMMRPNRSFRFEGGKLVVEEDVAAGITGYGTSSSGIVWPEIDITTAPQPTGQVVDSLYGYGQFGGNWAIGCRLHSGRNPICSVENAASNVTNTNNAAPCFRSAPARVIEMSDFEVCGSSHFGGDAGGDNGNYWRVCNSAAQEPDMVCRDRFRMELTQSSLDLYVNGHLYFEDANWPASSQIDPNAIANGQWYVYAVDWQGNTSVNDAFRFHWDNFAVNPHNADGTFTAPSAAPGFCYGQPNSTCMSGMTPVPTSAPTSTAVAPTATSTVTPTPTGTPTATSTPGAGTCTVQASLNGVVSTYTRPLSFCTNQ